MHHQRIDPGLHAESNAESPASVAFGPFTFDPREHLLRRRGNEIDLPDRSLRLLEVLIEAPGSVVTKDRLVERVWRGKHVSDTSLTEAMSRLRTALGDRPRQPIYIQTIHGKGYRFVSSVRPRLSAPPSAKTLAAGNLRFAATAALASLVAMGLVGLLLVGVHRVARGGQGSPLANGRPLSLAPLLIEPLQAAARLVFNAAALPKQRSQPLYRLAEVSLDSSKVMPYSVPALPLNGFSVESGQGRIAFSVRDQEESDAWIFEPDRGALRRVATGGFYSDPIWSPDGNSIVLASSREDDFDLVSIPMATEGPMELLLDRPLDQFPESWSADGRILVFAEHHPVTGYDIWALEYQVDQSWRPRPLVRTGQDEAFAAISPDGRYLLYVARREHRPEVYLLDLVSDGDPVRLSTEGGSYPFWSRNGREIHFIVADQVRTIDLADAISGGRPSSGTTSPIAGLYLAGSGNSSGRVTVAMLD